MSVYDLPRALQWLDSVQDERPNAKARADQTRIAIVAAALLKPGQRAQLMQIHGSLG